MFSYNVLALKWPAELVVVGVGAMVGLGCVLVSEAKLEKASEEYHIMLNVYTLHEFPRLGLILILKSVCVCLGFGSSSTSSLKMRINGRFIIPTHIRTFCCQINAVLVFKWLHHNIT